VSEAQFQCGDHLQIRRRHLYWHHGIYIAQNRVIEFGGGTIADKRGSVVRPVTLPSFENGSTAQVVQHPRSHLGGTGMGTPNPLPRPEIAARAEWLAAQELSGKYNLVGSNCEHVANWCVTNYFESLQVRRWFAVGAPTALVYFYAQKRLSHRASNTLGLTLAATAVFPFLYHLVPRLMWRDVLLAWPGYPCLDDRGYKRQHP
jgi:hypothetical protein